MLNMAETEKDMKNIIKQRWGMIHNKRRQAFKRVYSLELLNKLNVFPWENNAMPSNTAVLSILSSLVIHIRGGF